MGGRRLPGDREVGGNGRPSGAVACGDETGAAAAPDGCRRQQRARVQSRNPQPEQPTAPRCVSSQKSAQVWASSITRGTDMGALDSSPRSNVANGRRPK